MKKPRRTIYRKAQSPLNALAITVLLSGLPGALCALVLLYTGGYPARITATLTVIIGASMLAGVTYVYSRAEHTFRTISNILMAMREGDFSLRATRASLDDALGEVMFEINTFGDTLRDHRLEALEATTLLRKIMAETDVAIFAFDAPGNLKLVNPAGARLLGRKQEELLGESAAALGMEAALLTPTGGTAHLDFPNGQGRWGVRRGTFREDGLPHQFLVLANLDDALRQEELDAWQRLVRVLGHEINNTLTPIASMASSLQEILDAEAPDAPWQQDAKRVLTTIEGRTTALSRFTQAYARLARLPQPNRVATPVAKLVQDAVRLEDAPRLRISGGPDLLLHADPDQLEQVLINLLRNALDALPEQGGEVCVGWTQSGDWIEIQVEDSGAGLLDTANLFVPFFTTKASGSGIGLVLSRQIAEAHGGALRLQNRTDGPGCVATVRLPLEPARVKTVRNSA